MSHIMLFGLTTLGLALAGLAAGAGACEMPHADHAATPGLQVATAATEAAAIRTFQFRPKRSRFRPAPPSPGSTKTTSITR